MGAITFLVAGTIVLSACDSAAPTGTASPTPISNATPTATGGNILIGLAFSTSGDNAAYGISQKAAAQMAIDEINAAGKGPKLVPIFADTAGQPDTAFALFRKFIDIDKVYAIIGPTLSNEALNSDPEAQKSKVPVLAVSNTAAGVTDIGDYIFRDSLAEFQVIPETVKQSKEMLKLSKVSLMYANDDAFSKSGADVFRTELQKNDIKIIGEQTFSTKDTDFTAQLEAIKADKPDAIVVSALLNPAKLILQQARNDVGIDPKIHIIGGNGFNSPAIITAAGPAAEGVIVGVAWNTNAANDLSKQFITNFHKAIGKDPDQFAAQAYAGVYILNDAINRATLNYKSLEDARTAIRDALKSSNDIPTVLGPFSFADKRDADHPPVIQIVKDGKFDILK